MDYNELKVRVLEIFEHGKEFDSVRIREILTQDASLRVTDKAIEMALMRYNRQGLLSRSRRGRLFQYTLTDRGRARLAWLLKNQQA